MRDDDDAAGLAQLLQRLLYLQGIADVQGRAGFIEEQDLGPYSQAAGNAEALLLAQKKKGKRNKNVSYEELLPYRQIFDIPPYLLKHVFSRGHRILPVNEEQDNIICANASEAATLALCGGQRSMFIGVRDAQLTRSIGKLNYRPFRPDEVKASHVSSEQPSLIDDASIKDSFYGAPAVIAIFGEKDFSFSIADAFCAAENMILMATDLGLSSCIVSRGEETFATAEGQELLKHWSF